MYEKLHPNEKARAMKERREGKRKLLKKKPALSS